MADLVAREGLRRFRRLPPAPKAHPFTRILYDAMNRERIGVLDMAERSGVNKNTITKWRTRDVPQIEGLRACLNVVGLDLVIARVEDEDEGPDLAVARPFDLTRQEHDIFRALEARPWVRTTALCIAAVDAHEEPLLVEHLQVILSRIRKKTSRTITARDGGYALT